MAIDKETVLHVASLARIEIDESEISSLEGELSSILDWVAQLNEIDVEAIDPMTTPRPIGLRRRPDSVLSGGIWDEISSTAPHISDRFFVVPKVIE